MAAANGAIHLRKADPFTGSTGVDASNVEAVVSALVIPASEVNAFARGELMQSYHNVAELRHFRGAMDQCGAVSPTPFVTALQRSRLDASNRRITLLAECELDLAAPRGFK